jgi:hypothetical protein
VSTNKTDDAVSEYLYEVGARLSGLPLLQRRELLADLEAHIATERAERNVQSEGEVLEILERLGSPEVVAAAAYEEAGPFPPAGQHASVPVAGPYPPAAGRVSIPATAPRWPGWQIAAVIAAAVLVVTLVLGFLVVGLARGGDHGSDPIPAAPAAPVAPLPRTR